MTDDINELTSSQLLELFEAARRREEDQSREEGPTVPAEGHSPDTLPDTDPLFILTGRRHS